jgi:hypothetical protein
MENCRRRRELRVIGGESPWQRVVPVTRWPSSRRSASLPSSPCRTTGPMVVREGPQPPLRVRPRQARQLPLAHRGPWMAPGTLVRGRRLRRPHLPAREAAEAVRQLDRLTARLPPREPRLSAFGTSLRSIWPSRALTQLFWRYVAAILGRCGALGSIGFRPVGFPAVGAYAEGARGEMATTATGEAGGRPAQREAIGRGGDFARP